MSDSSAPVLRIVTIDVADVDVKVQMHGSEEAEELWEQARELEEQACSGWQQAEELRRDAVRRSRADGYELDAIAAAFGVTTSRIQQLAALPRRHQDFV